MREQKRSLFIIGAGASKDFNNQFPTGEELIEKLKKISMEFVKNRDKLNDFFYLSFNKNISSISCFAKDKNGDYVKKQETSEYRRMSLKSFNTADKNLNMFLGILLCDLINFYNPKSIDYFIGKDLQHYITDEHITKFQNLAFIINNRINSQLMDLNWNCTKAELKEKLEEYASKKVTEILQEIKGLTEQEENALKQNFKAQLKALDNETNIYGYIESIKEQFKEVLKQQKFNENHIKNGYFCKILCDEIGIDNIENVEIITFNYDLILEETIDYLLTINHTEERKKKLEALKSRIKHVYGDIKDGIHFIRDKPDEKCKELIAEADNIYFFGFAFDEQNLKNLGLTNKKQLPANTFNGSDIVPKERKVFITNHGGLARVEFRISRLFNIEFKPVKPDVKNSIHHNLNQYFYISEKTITNALKGDFFFE